MGDEPFGRPIAPEAIELVLKMGLPALVAHAAEYLRPESLRVQGR
jgi:hypothetical protein